MHRLASRHNAPAASLFGAALLGIAPISTAAPAAGPTPHEDAEPAPPANAAFDFDPALLAGPSINPKDVADSNSLVAFDYTGSLVELEVLPEIAALDLLTLTEKQETAIDDLILERSTAFDTILSRNFGALTDLMGIRNAEEQERREVLARTRELFAPISELGTLQSQIAAALPTAAAERYNTLIGAYRAALRVSRLEQRDPATARRLRSTLRGLGINAGPVASDAKGLDLMGGPPDAMTGPDAEPDDLVGESETRLMPGAQDAPPRARGIARMLDAIESGGPRAEPASRRLLTLFTGSAMPQRGPFAGLPPTFQHELRASYERIIESRPEPFERLIAELSLTPEREAEFRAAARSIRDQYRDSGGSMTRAERGDPARRRARAHYLTPLFELLTQDERRTARRLFRSGELMLPPE